MQALDAKKAAKKGCGTKKGCFGSRNRAKAGLEACNAANPSASQP
jgi:hypothetical protein